MECKRCGSSCKKARDSRTGTLLWFCLSPSCGWTTPVDDDEDLDSTRGVEEQEAIGFDLLQREGLPTDRIRRPK